MTLADLCTALLERESVIYTFTKTTSTESSFARVTQDRITHAAKCLKVFTRRELMDATGCSIQSARHWVRLHAHKEIVEYGRSEDGNESSIVWRWL